jgi:hypothetical protein
MKNSDLPANPIYYKDRDGQDCLEAGLTKREYFAGLAMQGLMNRQFPPAAEMNGKPFVEWVAQLSCEMADELLKQLSHDH